MLGKAYGKPPQRRAP